jgi:osmotically-inducible protein OsmY
MKKRTGGILGLGAVAAGVAAFFLHPRKGRERREAVRRGGERLAQRGAGVTALMGTRRRQEGGAAADLRARITAALREELGPDGLALQVTTGEGGSVTVRGEVGSLEQISRASEVIESLSGGAEIDNLIRLRAPAGGGAPTG